MKYFTIEELCKSTTAEQRGIDNTPTDEIKDNLQYLIENLLDPIRELYGKPITISSGYRCPELNKAVGGVPTSDHQNGYSADLDLGGATENKPLFDLIKDSGLEFDQLIWENKGAWVHVSCRREGNRKQVLEIG